MAEHQLEKAIEGLKKEKNELSEIAAEKIQKLSAELEDADRSSQPIDPLEKIQTGFMNFRVNQFEQYPWLYWQLAQDQAPHFLVFACSDSRVSPTFILNFIPGKAFMARNIANLVPPFDFDKVKFSGVGAIIEYADAGEIIEYAVTALKVETILVIGHSRCGGIKRLMTLEDDPNTQYDFIDDWMKIATPAKEIVNQNFPHEGLEQRCERCEKESVNLSLENLESYPYLKDVGPERKKVRLLGGYYDFVTGHFLVWPKGFSDHPLVIPPTHPPPPPPRPFQ